MPQCKCRHYYCWLRINSEAYIKRYIALELRFLIEDIFFYTHFFIFGHQSIYIFFSFLSIFLCFPCALLLLYLSLVPFLSLFFFLIFSVYTSNHLLICHSRTFPRYPNNRLHLPGNMCSSLHVDMCINLYAMCAGMHVLRVCVYISVSDFVNLLWVSKVHDDFCIHA